MTPAPYLARSPQHAVAGEPFLRRAEVLPNGLRVVAIEAPYLHSVSVVLYAKVGSRYESETDNGLSHFLEHMLFRGTEARPEAYLVNRDLEALGGTLYAETGRDYSLYQISLHPESLIEGLKLFGEIFAGPVFKDIEVERRIILEEMLEDVDEDNRLVSIDDLGRRAVFGEHPLGSRIIGSEDNVRRFTVEDLRRHYARAYGAKNLVLTLSGPIDLASIWPLLSASFGGLPSGTELHSPAPKLPVQRQLVFEKKSGPQTTAQLLFRAFAEPDPLYPAMAILTRLIDDGMSTRLHRRLIDELGLAYSVQASPEIFYDCGLYEIEGTAQHKNVAELVRESLGLVTALCDTPPSIEELEKAKRRYRWDLEASFDDPDALAGWFGGAALYHVPLGYGDKISRLAAVSADDVTRAAQAMRAGGVTAAIVGQLRPKAEAEVRALLDAF